MTTSGLFYYVMVAGISHDIAFGVYHVGCNGIPHGHVVCLLTMWYCLVKTTENFNFGYLEVRNNQNHGIKEI